MDIIKEIKAAKIDKIIAGGANGSIILFDLIKGSDKYVLYIYCTWRLSLSDKILTGWNDSDTIFVKELHKLKGEIINVVTSSELGDFTLFFINGIKLEVFCDITSNIEDTSIEENWSLCNISKNQCYNFTNNFTFFTELFEEN